MQLGISEETEFTTIESEAPQPSSMSIWPSEQNPDEYYKITSSFVTLSMDQNIIERQTYSFLEWLGDIGGLYDALRIIGALLIAPLTSFKVKSELLTNIFRFTKSKRKTDKIGT